VGGYTFPEAFGPNLGQDINIGNSQGRQRSTSHSETWNQSGFGGYDFSAQQQQHQNQAQQLGQQQQQINQQNQQQQINQQQRAQLNAFAFGGGEMTRSASESLGVARGHRISRSEDIRGGLIVGGNNANDGSNDNNTAHTGFAQPAPPQRAYDHRQHSLSVSGYDFHSQFLHPNNHLGGNTSRRSLSPAGSHSNVNSSGGQPAGRGHFRRLSTGSRSDRGAEVWGTEGGGAPGHGVQHLSVQRRVSPYPSPNASPRVRYGELDEEEDGLNMTLFNSTTNLSGGGLGLGHGLGGQPSLLNLGPGASSMALALPPTDMGEPPVSAGFSDDVNIAGRGGYSGLNLRTGSGSAHGGDGASSHGGRAGSTTSVAGGEGTTGIAKQNVTTGRTAKASIQRRKQDANFACTVPGCNSTFTRGFNLKGHLRSHYEQKPYKCHWPGCGKGFARQHDCKRHEQLHSNFRPFECDGCRKQFARMDALNRHLRSEAGADCARVMDKSKLEGGGGELGLEDVEMGTGMGNGLEEEVLQTGRPAARRRNTGVATALTAAQVLGDEEWTVGVAL